MKHQPRGFIALISAVIISTVLLTLAVSIGSNTFFSRFDALNHEYKRLSLGFAESCITTALGKIGGNFNYSAGNVLVSLGTLYGKPAECTIESVSSGAVVNGKKTFTITAKANFNNAFSTITTKAIAQDPATAPVTPPPTCALSPSAVSVPGGSTVPFAWSTAGASISALSMDRGVGSLSPFSSGTGSFVAPISAGTYTYTATVTNPGGNSTCNIVLTVTPPPPSPACADTVMIFDRTGSMGGGDLTNERNAGTALTNLYAGVSSLPKISAGSFGAYPNAALPAGAASVPASGQLTSSYSSIISLINSITGSNSGVGSNLGAAINAGAGELNSGRHTAGKQKVLIFVSDGVPNEPNSSTAQNTGFLPPSSNSANNTLTGDLWSTPANAYGAGVATDSASHRHRYADFNFGIPNNAVIGGIEVQANAQSSTFTTSSTVFTDSFGTGTTDTTFNESPAWVEGGGGAEKRAAGTGNDSASPDGGRFASIDNGGWICQTINATNVSSLLLSYYWRGDIDAGATDDLIVEYHPTSTNCNTTTGWATLTTQDLNTNTGAWVQRTNIALPAAFNNDPAFIVRFRSTANATIEDARVDGVTITGSTSSLCTLGLDMSWNGGTTWTTERSQALTTTATTYTLGTPTDTWGRTWTANDFSNTNFRMRVHASPTGPTCSLDTLTARVSYTIPTSPTQYALDADAAAKAAGVNIFSIHYGDTAGQTFMGQLASNSTIPNSSITTATRSGTTVTVTTSAAHRLTSNQRVQISGVSSGTLNGTFTVVSTPTPNTFTYTTSSSGTINATGGSVAPTNLFLSPASSAMTGIFQSIGFQVCPAAAPSCSNTVDDDGDGVKDDQDSGCHTDGNAGNPASFDPNDTDEWTAPPVPIPPAPPPPPPNITIGSWVEVP